MQFIYPFITTFIIVFLSELGDKTQLLVLSFSNKDKAKNILLGVAFGTFLSHGMAILFGSKIASFENETFQFYLQLFTYISFFVFGIAGFLSKSNNSNDNNSTKASILTKLSKLKLNYIVFVALAIIVGELGDKTFLASLGLGLQYPNYKLFLVLGSVAGMVASNSIALFFGKLLGNKFNPKFIEFLSNLIFITFGIIGFIKIRLILLNF